MLSVLIALIVLVIFGVLLAGAYPSPRGPQKFDL